MLLVQSWRKVRVALGKCQGKDSKSVSIVPKSDGKNDLLVEFGKESLLCTQHVLLFLDFASRLKCVQS